MRTAQIHMETLQIHAVSECLTGMTVSTLCIINPETLKQDFQSISRWYVSQGYIMFMTSCNKKNSMTKDFEWIHSKWNTSLHC